MASRSWDEFILQTEKEPIGGNEHRFDLVFRQRCEHAVDLANASGGEGDKSQTKHVRGCLQVAQLRFRIRIVRIDERADYEGVGDKFVQYFQVLRPQLGEHKSDAREIARWSVKTRYEIRCDWITASYENNRYCLSCSLCGSRSNQVGSSDAPTRFTIKSAAKAGSRSYSPSAQRCSIVTSRPSLMPASIKPCPKAAVRCDGSGRPSCKNPIAGSTRCARAASGHVAAPLRSAMASRRLMKVAIRPSGEGSCPIEYGDYSTPQPRGCGTDEICSNQTSLAFYLPFAHHGTIAVASI